MPPKGVHEIHTASACTAGAAHEEPTWTRPAPRPKGAP